MNGRRKNISSGTFPSPGLPGLGKTTISATELAKFKSLAGKWWDTDGEFRTLHELNPVRIRYIRDQLAAHFSRDVMVRQPFHGLSLLDIGCGGGLLAEPLARLGFSVTGIDALDSNIQVARIHAAEAGLPMAYRCATAEDLNKENVTFDAVISMEVVEHVARQSFFLKTAATLVAPGGMMVIATINRTLHSLILAKVCAEYILRWLPIGTHDWWRFVRPSELAAGLRRGGLTVLTVKGMSYAPFTGAWHLSNDSNVNYFMVATRLPSFCESDEGEQHPPRHPLLGQGSRPA